MFFIASKILWFLLAPFNLALFALTGAMLAMGMKRHGLARCLGVLAWLVLIVFGVLPTGLLATHYLESCYPAHDILPRPVQGIIVLGGALDTETGLQHKRPQLKATADRLTVFADLGRKYPWAKLVFTGGDGTLAQNGTPEGAMIRDALADMGFYPRGRLRIEADSRTTWENALNTKALMSPKPGERWILVTSAWHMPRAVGAFRAAGWDVLPYPVDYLTPAHPDFMGNMQLAHVALKEFAGIAAYWLTGKWRPEGGSAGNLP